MTSPTSSSASASHCLKALPPLPPSTLDIPETSDESDTISTPIHREKNLPSAKSSIWFTDTADLFILLCSFILTAISIVFVALVLHLQLIQVIQTEGKIPRETLSILQRVISSLSVTITSAVVLVAGKRYAFFKLARGGLRSRRVAVYSNPSIGALISYLVLHGAELPLLGLSALWVLALVTSLTVDNSWTWGSVSASSYFMVPSGPLDPVIPGSGSQIITTAAAHLGYIQLSVCFGLEREVGLINMSNPDHPMGIIYYPPLPNVTFQNVGFSISTTMNGFDFSMERLSSVPPTAQSLSCSKSSSLHLWSDGSDSQTLSIIASKIPPLHGTDAAQDLTQLFRFNATAIIMGGILSSTRNHLEFLRNETSWLNVMSKDSQWAQDITSLICNTSIPLLSGGCIMTPSLIDFAGSLNNNSFRDGNMVYSALSMALGAYSAAMYPSAVRDSASLIAPITLYDFEFTLQYGTYILILHIVASLSVLAVVLRLRLASPLGADFIHPTRLLLDPLEKPELFNASLETTLNALEDPYMVVSGSEFLVTKQKVRETRERKGFPLRNFKSSDSALT